MKLPSLRFRLLYLVSFFAVGLLAAQPSINLDGYRTVDKAITAKITAGDAGAGGQTGYLGVAVIRNDQGKLVVEDVQPESPGDKAGLKKGDNVTRVGEHPVASPQGFREWLQSYSPGATVKLSYVREGKTAEATATLAATSRPMAKGGAGGDGMGAKGGGKGGKGGGGVGGPLPLVKQPVFRLAVIGIEFSDVKHNAKVTEKDWNEAFFSKGLYIEKKNATGQTVHGSLNDYFQEQSYGAFRLEGKTFEWVNVGKKRADYIQGSGTTNKGAVLADALAKLETRDGKDALKDFDGIAFLYAGDRYKTNAGAIYYPHASGVQHQGKRMPYLIHPEGGTQMPAINPLAKLVGQALGLPDLAARTEDAGSRGLGAWCALSVPTSSGRPQHFSAWAKEKLGWIKPAVIDPTVKQKLILAPIEDAAKECVKVLVRPNGGEYYLLENRKKKGFDADLPGEGLLIWRVVNDRPILVESHGVDNPSAPSIHLTMIPYPSEANRAFTPDTTPSSRSPLGGGLPVHITDIRRLEDGRIAFSIGYEFR